MHCEGRTQYPPWVLKQLAAPAEAIPIRLTNFVYEVVGSPMPLKSKAILVVLV
jgi:hypothetical protein